MSCKLNPKKTRCIKASVSDNDPIYCSFNTKSNRCIKNPNDKKKISPISIAPPTKFVKAHDFFSTMAKNLDNQSIVIIRYINMNQNGVVDDIAFIENKNITKIINKWKIDVPHLYLNFYSTKNRLVIIAIDESDYDYHEQEYWDQMIIYNKDEEFLKNLIEQHKE